MASDYELDQAELKEREARTAMYKSLTELLRNVSTAIVFAVEGYKDQVGKKRHP